jgi:tetratricopeptide (TPR) repeat protein
MTDNSRIEDLRRRVQKDPASIAFAQLGEEYRRAGQYQESVDACRAGLAVHPAYLSARVTLGRALIELGSLEDAEKELSLVLKSAPENLAAIRGTADIHRQRGDSSRALDYYRVALSLAKNDPELQETVAELTRKLGPTRGPEPKDGLSFDDMHRELTARASMQTPDARPHGAARIPAVTPKPASKEPAPPSVTSASAAIASDAGGTRAEPRATGPTPLPAPAVVKPTAPPLATPAPAPAAAAAGQAARDRALRTIAALEQWLAAIHAARPQPAS